MMFDVKGKRVRGHTDLKKVQELAGVTGRDAIPTPSSLWRLADFAIDSHDWARPQSVADASESARRLGAR